MPQADPPQTTVYFPLTVDSDLSLTAQSLLRRECGGQINSIRLEPVPDRHEMRLWVTLTAAAYGLVLHTVIMGMTAAEFGAVRIANAEASALANAT